MRKAPTVSVKGTSLRDLLVKERDLIDGYARVLSALACCAPHPRDYPSTDDWTVARHSHREETARIMDLRDAAQRRAEVILAQEGPESWRRAAE